LTQFATAVAPHTGKNHEKWFLRRGICYQNGILNTFR